MEWLERLNRSLQYIEDHLDGAVDCKKAAQSACCSYYQYQDSPFKLLLREWNKWITKL